MRILGIIPARGGSKGIPRKNLVDVCGRPLIAYSIKTGQALVEVGALQRCVVSTEDEELATVARAAGGDVPFRRPAVHASDEAKSVDGVLHALDALAMQGFAFDAVLVLQPTAPIRDVAAMVQAIERFCSGTADSMISCYQEDRVNECAMYHDQRDGTLTPVSPLHNEGTPRQAHSPVMIRNGSLYLTRVSYIRQNRKLVCDRPMVMRMRKAESIDVDTPDDLDLLRAVLCK